MKKLLSLALLVAGSSSAFAQEEQGAKWYNDFDEAAAVAAETGRDMIVDFTGSDW
jgi:opacity protein-like surface antigen